MTWGDLADVLPDDRINGLVGVCELCATSGAFAAKLVDGTVVKLGSDKESGLWECCSWFCKLPTEVSDGNVAIQQPVVSSEDLGLQVCGWRLSGHLLGSTVTSISNIYIYIYIYTILHSTAHFFFVSLTVTNQRTSARRFRAAFAMFISSLAPTEPLRLSLKMGKLSPGAAPMPAVIPVVYRIVCGRM